MRYSGVQSDTLFVLYTDPHKLLTVGRRLYTIESLKSRPLNTIGSEGRNAIMSKSTRFMYLLYVTMLSFHATIVTAQSNQEVVRDQVGFRSVLSDSEIGTLINTYNVKPTAVFMWMSGLSATHRVNDDMNREKRSCSSSNKNWC